MHLDLGGRPWRPEALRAGALAWAARLSLQPLDPWEMQPAEDAFGLILSQDTAGWGWLALQRRGEEGLRLGQELGRFIAISAGRALSLYATGAGPGSGRQTVLEGQHLRIGPDGELRERAVPAAEAFMRDRNPVDDDCPHEDFYELMQHLLGDACDPDEREELERLRFQQRPFDDDPRVSRAIRRALVARAFEVSDTPEGRVTLHVRDHDGARETLFFDRERGARVRAALEG